MKTSNGMMVQQIGMWYSRSAKKKVSQCLVKSHRALFVHQRYNAISHRCEPVDQNRTRPSHNTGEVALPGNFRIALSPGQTKD